ncbi:MAG: hydrolase [Desulfobacteraceae bacterium]|nr:MAG: hydrolase [Desulfobacteraceae bacterium]
MGYSIQVGAFSDVQNALRVIEALDRRSVTAYYFRDSSGLLKVRFGDFSTMEEARMAAETLAGAGVIDAFEVVRPEDYAVAKTRVYGAGGLRKEIVATARSFVGTGYQWGGQSPEEGFDCSGLAVAVYQLNGLNLPRTSSEQYLAGAPVKKGRLDQGDLVFFSIKKDKKVNHVGVYAGDGRFIHAPGKGKTIRYDLLEHHYYSSRYIGGRTYL